MVFALAISGVARAEGEGNINDLGKDGKEKPKSGFSLDNKQEKHLTSFSLRSNMSFKGENLIQAAPATNYVNFNTSISYQKGQNSYLMPYKKKVILRKVTFNPNEVVRSYTGR
ncbi:hypothetical protein [Niabella terrae]